MRQTREARREDTDDGLEKRKEEMRQDKKRDKKRRD